MTPAGRVAALIELMAALPQARQPADAMASAWFRSRRFIGGADRREISTRFWDMIRRQARLGWWLDRLEAPHTARNRVIADGVLCGGQSLVALERIFTGEKFCPHPLDAAEKKLALSLSGQSLDHPEMPEDVRLEVPEWAAGPLRAALGDNFAAEMAAMLTPAPLDLRVNTLKLTRDAATATLAEAGFPAIPTRWSPWGLRLAERAHLGGMELLRDGMVDIQDEGSQLVALLCGAKPGQRVVDFCAGAGGKTLALAQMMNNRGHIIAADNAPGRLKQARLRLRRAGVHNAEIKPLAHENDKWVKRQAGAFDVVLVDAPCTGTGTWRRNPADRWQRLGPDLDRLVTMQASILAGAARLARPGGRVVYATCSLLPQENEAQIEAFLSAHADFQTVDIGAAWSGLADGDAPCPGPHLRLSPAAHGTDGFFAAVLERKA